MKNYGIAKCTVNILGELPNIDATKRKYNFDITAAGFDLYSNSPILPPLLADYVADPLQTFGAIFPTTRCTNIDNYILKDSSLPATTLPWISWRSTEVQDGIVEDLLAKFLPHSSYVQSPSWQNIPEPYQSKPDDSAALSKWFDWMGIESSASDAPSDEVTETPKVMWIHQQNTLAGLWWGIESHAFLLNNMPFWVQIKRQQSPTTDKYESLYVISFGLTDKNQRFDIHLSNRSKPRIIDYARGGGSGLPGGQKEFDVDLSRIMDSDVNIDVAVMTIAGRLVVFVNNVKLVYTRVNSDNGDNNGVLDECKITSGAIRIYGTN
ncbi:MAG: hypothetical protein WC375_12055, partial [Methanomassiliicoccales archaeon]